MGKKKTLRKLRITSVQIASGNHATCYAHPTKKNKIVLVTNCPARKSLSQGDFHASRYFPKNVRNIGELNGIPAYEMEKYLEVDTDKLSQKDLAIYQALLDNGDADSYEIPKKLKKALNRTHAMLSVSNRTTWDICSHNMMMTKDYKLVLNDLYWVCKD